ncbi:MAG: response regulator [Thermaceae bacterium]|nr:response regulator [Thermaceae bacterium]
MDVYLPDGSGLELVQALRAEGCDSEVILITAASDLASVQGALRSGALDYLIKPFQQHRLREALSRYRTRVSVAGERNFTQSRLDRLLGYQGEGRLPKGLDPLTLERVEQAISSADQALSAEEVASRVGLSRVSAWRYLEYLCEQGTLLAEMTYGSVGRPTKRYKPHGRS